MPYTWDLDAQYLALKPPALFDGYFGAENTEHPAAPAVNPRNDSEGVTKPTTQLSAAAQPTPYVLLNRRRRPPTQRSPPETLANSSPR